MYILKYLGIFTENETMSDEDHMTESCIKIWFASYSSVQDSSILFYY